MPTTLSSREVSLKAYFITGLLIWVPLAITAWVLNLLIGTLDQTLNLLPQALVPDNWVGRNVPGMGVVLTGLILFVTGLLARNFIGERLVRASERLLSRIPIVRGIYSSVKQVSDTILSPDGNAFRQALLVQYPREGVWTIAFQTGTPSAEIVEYLPDELISVYVPTTPNPTSGFFLMMRRDQVHALTMSVDDALKYVVSMGVVTPEHLPEVDPIAADAVSGS